MAFTEGFLDDPNVAYDATHFEARDASKSSQKKETTPKKRACKSKEERATWLAEQAEIEANLTTYEKNLAAQLMITTKTLWQDIPSNSNWGDQEK